MMSHGRAKPNIQCDKNTISRNDWLASYFKAFRMYVVPLTVASLYSKNEGILTTNEIQKTANNKPRDHFFEKVRLEKGFKMNLSRSMDNIVTRKIEMKRKRKCAGWIR